MLCLRYVNIEYFKPFHTHFAWRNLMCFTEIFPDIEKCGRLSMYHLVANLFYCTRSNWPITLKLRNNILTESRSGPNVNLQTLIKSFIESGRVIRHALWVVNNEAARVYSIKINFRIQENAHFTVLYSVRLRTTTTPTIESPNIVTTKVRLTFVSPEMTSLSKHL